jgi:outer membrane autotransporter protein
VTTPLDIVINIGPVDRLVASLCDAVKGLGAQSSVSVLAATSLTGAIMGRLDAGRVQSEGGSSGSSGGGGNDGRMSLGAVEKTRPGPAQGTAGPLTVYAGGTFLAGSSPDRPEAAGLTYDGGSGMIGLEYSINRNLILGVAGSFAAMDANLNTGATVGAEVMHGAAYLSYATRALFVDALAAYGAIGLDLSRPGTVEETVRASTSGGAFALAARGGYLFDFGKLRAGPIAGLTYIHARIDGYSEAGEDPSAMKVEDQTVESVTGSAGVRFLAPFQAGGSVFVPYLNITLEHNFGDGKAELTTSLTGAPSGSPVSISFPTFGVRDYGKVEGGLTVELTPSASVTLSGASTFAGDDGHDYRLSAGLNYRF